MAGEWFLDIKEGSLYLIPPAGKKIGNLSLVPVHRPSVFVVSGNSSDPVKHVTLANVTIAHAAPTYCQYKAQNILELSIENAEIMENCP